MFTFTVIDKHCLFELQWRTRYACRLCDRDKDYTNMFGECVNGEQLVTRVQKGDCRATGTIQTVTVTSRLCSVRALI